MQFRSANCVFIWRPASTGAFGITDPDIFNFALNLRIGSAARNAANAISDARDSLDGPDDLDQGIFVNGRANIVLSDSDGRAFARTPQQVLRIVYLTDRSGVSGGGIFPNGMNGKLRTT